MIKILYIGPLYDGSTALNRAQSLIRLGCQLVSVDTFKIELGASRISRSLAHRFHAGPLVEALNLKLQNLRANYDVLWVDKGVWLLPETVDILRERSALRLAVHYTPDAQFLQHGSKRAHQTLRAYDLLVTTKWFEESHYKSLEKRYLVVKQGFDNRILKMKSFGYADRKRQLLFIGHCQKHYRRQINAIAKSGIPHEVAGRGWMRQLKHGINVSGDGLWGDDYFRALSESYLTLGLLSKYIPETSTTRSFEIPATGSLFVAERTWEHMELYEDRKEAFFFDSEDEMIDLVNFCLENPKVSQHVAERGKVRAISEGYDSESQMAIVLKELGVGL